MKKIKFNIFMFGRETRLKKSYFLVTIDDHLDFFSRRTTKLGGGLNHLNH